MQFAQVAASRIESEIDFRARLHTLAVSQIQISLLFSYLFLSFLILFVYIHNIYIYKSYTLLLEIEFVATINTKTISVYPGLDYVDVDVDDLDIK